jgi:hypothetical protein
MRFLGKLMLPLPAPFERAVSSLIAIGNGISAV